MPHVHGFARRTSPSVQIKWLTFLVEIQKMVKITVRKEDPTAEEAVRLFPSEPLDAVEEGLVDPLAAELGDEPVVIDIPFNGEGVHGHLDRNSLRRCTG